MNVQNQYGMYFPKSTLFKYNGWVMFSTFVNKFVDEDTRNINTDTKRFLTRQESQEIYDNYLVHDLEESGYIKETKYF